ncbi:hypothetical protein MFRU_002g03010 [Monilinia fructicola]|nr:hypothetical protein MFRU_002g03010 [Monilinia fructicola]
MLSTGFTDVPVTRSLVYGIVATSFLASITDSKHLFYIQADPHLLRYHQLWRMFTYQLCYTNSTEVFFGAITYYNMRVVERLWGSRRFASFLLISFCFTSIISPILLVLLRPLSLYAINYLPAGPTALIFAILAQYHAVIPHQYKYKVAATSAPMTEDNFVGVTFSDKSYIYLLAIQLGLSQFPGSVISAVVGWIIGYCWRNDVLPAAITRWRLPGWMVGVQTKKRSEGFEGMRRRLEGENTAAATGSDGQLGGEVGRRRTLANQFIDQFRGAP